MKRYFIAGLIVWVPIWVILLIFQFLIDLFNKVVDLIPQHYQPAHWLGFNIPGLGLILTILLVFFTGMLVTNFLGNKILKLWEKLLSKIPLVRSIFNAVNQVMQTIFASKGQSFRKVLLVEYPRKGLWSIAFQTSQGFAEGKTHIAEDLITIFIPTTPNPTSGFLMFVPKSEVIELEMPVDDALKLVISLGIVVPENRLNELNLKRGK